MSLILCDDYADPILKQLTMGSIVVLYHVDRNTRESLEARLGDITKYTIGLMSTASVEDVGIVCLTLGLTSRLKIFIESWKRGREVRSFDHVGRYMVRSDNYSLLTNLMECVLYRAINCGYVPSYMGREGYIQFVTSRANYNVSEFLPFVGAIVGDAITTNKLPVLELVFKLIHQRHHKTIYDEGLDVAMKSRNEPSILLLLSKGARGRMGPGTLNVVVEMNNNDLFDRYIESTARPVQTSDYGLWIYLEETLKIAISKKNDYITNGLIAMVKDRAPHNVFLKLERFHDRWRKSTHRASE